MAYISQEEIDAAARFLAEFGKKYPVTAAFWVKEAEDPFWYLYLVSDQISDANFDEAYREVLRISRALQDPYFDPFRVKLRVRPEWTQAATEFQKRFPLKTGTRIRGGNFGETSVDEVYIYPSPITTPV
jgi:hypothetical protein